MKNKLLLLLFVMIFGVLLFGALSVSAATYGDLTYTVSGGVVTIEDCSESASGDLIIPDKINGYPVTSIGNSAFRYCTGLTSITIPDSVTSIGNYAFGGCDGLTKVNITDIEAWCKISFSDNANPLSYAGNLYLNDELVTDLIIPNSVTSIGSYAFYNCDGLTKVNITDIEAWCKISFSDNANPLSYAGNLYLNDELVTDLIIPNSVTSIGSYAFYDCNKLTSVTIGDGVELVPESAFYSCSNLKYVALSESVKYIRNDAFNYCSNIETVFYEGDEADWNKILFYNRNENLTNAKVVYNASKKTYKFETNCNFTVDDITNYAVFASPSLKNENKTLVGWYDNEALSGEPVSFPYYGSATTLYAAWTDKTGLSFDDAFTVKENREYTVTIKESGQLIYYEFVPRFSGEYRFYSEGNLDTYGYLYNSSKSQITYNDDAGEGNNFYISYNLTAGNKYYIAAKIYSGTGTFTLVTETDCIESTKTVCVTGSDGENIFITIPYYLPENAQILLACTKDGRLTELKSVPNKNETIYFVVTKEFDSAKVMVWEALESMIPMCSAETVK